MAQCVMSKKSPIVHARVREVTERIRERSRDGRRGYLARMDAAHGDVIRLDCHNGALSLM